MAKGKLVIDGQIFQTEAKDRGMGRYSVCLVQAVIASKAYDEVEVIVTKDLKGHGSVKKSLSPLFPKAKFVVLDLKTTTRTKIEDAFQHNRHILNKHMAAATKSQQTIDFLIPSPFQEPIVSVFPDHVKKLMIFYDLIPYLYHQRYQQVMYYDDYLKRYAVVLEADQIFTISQSVLDDLHTYIGIPLDSLTRIDGAPIRTDHRQQKPGGANIPKRFILMPTSDDPRKNNLRAVLGFEEFHRVQGDKDLKLVITSKIHKRERDHLSLFSDNLVFTGNLEEAELNWLYKECEAVLFVPESEGLGLPVLEAVEGGKKVTCSTLGVFKEISEDAFCYCNHEDHQSIAEALAETMDERRPINKSQYDKILAHYSWPKTAERFAAGAAKTVAREYQDRPRLAIFTPTPDGLSAIGKIVAESHPVMSRYFNIDYYVEKGLYAKPVRPNYLQYVANCYRAQDFSVERYARYDAVVYHIGNGDYHLESIKNGLYLPGYVILHDTNIKEAYRVLNETGMMHESRVLLEEILNQKRGVESASYLTSLLHNQLGVLAHSGYARQAAQLVTSNEVPATAVNLPSNVPSLPRFKESNHTVIGLAGIIADVKGIEVIEAIANDPGFKDCDIRLFGFSHATQETIDRLNSYDNVIVTTNLSDLEFQTNISKLDIFVNFRLRYNGETSLSTIEAMRQGVVVLVKDVGWYSELPDDVVVKVKNQNQVFDKLRQLVAAQGVMTQIGERAKRHIAEHFSHEQYAEGLAGLLRQKDTTAENKMLSTRLRKGNIRSPRQYLELYRRIREAGI